MEDETQSPVSLQLAVFHCSLKVLSNQCDAFWKEAVGEFIPVCADVMMLSVWDGAFLVGVKLLVQLLKMISLPTGHLFRSL